MAESSGGGNAFLGVLVGAFVVGLIIVGFFVFSGRVGGDSLNVKIDTPKIETPG